MSESILWGLQFFWSWECFNLCWKSDYELGFYSNQFWGLPKLTCFHKTLKSISLRKSWNYCNSMSREGWLGTGYKSMLSTVLGFREGRVIAPFLQRRPQVFPLVGVIINLKRFDVLLDNKLSVIKWYLFCFCLIFCWRRKMSNTSSSSLRSFHIYRKLNGRRKCKVLYEEEGRV